MDILVGSLFAGLLIGMILALVALGLTIIFGVMGIVNFAHGEFLMIGMHTGLLVGKSFDIGMGIIVPATKLAAAGLSVAAFFAVWLLMHRTRVGKALTATALDAQGARYMGVPTERMMGYRRCIGHHCGCASR